VTGHIPRRVSALVVATVAALVMAPAALAYEAPTAAFTAGVGTMAGSGLTQTFTAAGATTLGTATTIGARGWASGQHNPDLATSTPAQDVIVGTGTCPSTGACSGLGTLTVTFSRPVTNPTVHFAGIGGATGSTAFGSFAALSELHSVFTLTTAGLTLTKANAGGNLAVTGGTTVTTANPDTSPTCTSTDFTMVGTDGKSYPASAAAVAGCGSVRVNGTTTSLTFAVSAVYTQNAHVAAPNNQTTAADGVSVLVTVPDDYGDAPTSYDAGNAARAAISTIMLGSAVTEDAATTVNATTSPNAGASAAGDSDDGASPADLLTTATSYSTTVSLTAAAAGQLCGWVDFDRNHLFDTAERSCQQVTPGQRSATLSWTGLTGLVAGTSYARFRIGYNTTQTQSPTGASDSGEIEDYALQIVAPTPPTTAPDTASTPQNVTTTVPVLANDSAGPLTTLVPSSLSLYDPGDGTYKAVVTIAGQGTYTANTDGTVTFDPLPAFTGPATALTYRIGNDQGQTSRSTLTVTVTAITPDAVNDQASTAYRTAVTVPVLGNDVAGATSAPLDPTSVRLLNPGTGSYGTSLSVTGQGTYAVQAGGSVTFTPGVGFSGSTTPVTYRVADTNGTTDTATLAVTVSAPGAATANPDTATTPQNVTVAVHPLANDTTDAKAAFLPSTVAVRDPATGTYQAAITVAGEGTYTVGADGSVTFDPVAAFTGTATPVGYRVSDDAGRTVTSTITVTVTPIVPTARDDGATTAYQNAVTLSPLANDSAGATSAPVDPASLVLRDPSGPGFGSTATVTGQGTFAVGSGGTVTFTPVAGFFGAVDAVTYRITDANGTTATAVLRVTVTEPPATVAHPDTVTTPQNVTVTLSPVANDTTDPAVSVLPASLRLRAPGDPTDTAFVAVPGEATYTVNADGTVTVDPEPGFTGTATPVPYRVTDSAGRTVTSTITATVTPITPIARNDATTTPIGIPVTVAVLPNDTPGAASAPLDPATVALIDPDDGTEHSSLTVPGVGTWSVLPAGTVQLEPVAEFSGRAAIGYVVRDTNGTRATATVAVGVGDPPLAGPDTGLTLQNVHVDVDILSNDTPGTDATFDVSSIVLLDPGTGTYTSSVSLPDQGTLTVNPDGTVGFDPLASFTGTTTPVTYRATDTDGKSASSTVAVEVTPVVPTAVDDDIVTPAGRAVTVDVLANDRAGDVSAPLDPSSVAVIDPADGTHRATVTVAGEGTYAVQPGGAVAFTPQPGFVGDSSVHYVVADANGTLVSAALTVTVGAPPVAHADAVTTLQNVTVTVPVLDNDVPGGHESFDPHSVRLLDPADAAYRTSLVVEGEGSYTVGADGSVTFDPEPGFSGTATPVTYEATDTDEEVAGSTLTVTVTPVVPIVTDDAPTTPFRTAVTVDVLADDHPGASSAPLVAGTLTLVDPADSGAVTSLSVPGEGSYAVATDGTVTFTPDRAFHGPATPVTYRVADANGTTGTATLSVTVTAPEALVALDDTVSTAEGVTATVHPLGNDSTDPAAALVTGSLTLVDPVGGTTSSSVVVPGEGRYAAQSDGTVTFTPDPGFSGTGHVDYRISDDAGRTSSATISVVVAAVVPIALDDAASTPYETPVAVSVLANDSEGAATAPLDASSVQLLDPASGVPVTTLTLAGQGAYAVQPDGSVTFAPVPGFFGSVTAVRYTVEDANGTPATATIRVVVGLPPAPSATPDLATTPQNVSVTVSPLDNDTFAPDVSFERGSLRLLDAADGKFHATVTVVGEGSYTANLDGTVTFDPVATFSGQASPVTYRFDDSANQRATSTITVTVVGITPVATNDFPTTPYAAPLDIDVLGNDQPGAASAPLDPSSVLLLDPSTSTYRSTVTVAGQGSYVANGDGSVTFTPESGFTGAATPVTYRVADHNGSTATASVTVTVAMPAPPTAQPDSETTPQHVPVTVEVLANDVAGVGATLPPSTVRLLDPVDSVPVTTVTLAGEGTFTVAPDGSVDFEPDVGFVGDATVAYQVSDELGQTATATVSVTVTAVVPVAADDTAHTPSGRPVTLEVLANDTAGDPSAPLDPGSVVLLDPADDSAVTSLVVAGQGTYAVQADGAVTYTPEPGYEGAASPVDYRVADANGTTATARIIIGVGAAPVALPDDATTAQHVTVTVDVLDNDVPGTDAILVPSSVRLLDPSDGSYVTTVTTADGTVTVGADGSVTVDPAPAVTGDLVVGYRVTDSDGLEAQSTLRVTVTPVTPVATNDTATTPFHHPVTVAVLDNDAEGAPSAPLDASSVRLRDPADSTYGTSLTVPGEGSYTVASGSVTFVPDPSFQGVTSAVTYRVADTNGTRVTATLQVVVGDAPVAAADRAGTLQNTSVTVHPLANDSAGAGAAFGQDAVVLIDPTDAADTTVLDVPGEGTYTVHPSGTVTFVPSRTFTGDATPVTYRVTDSDGNTATATIAVTVTAVTPRAVDDSASTRHDQPVTVPVLDNDVAGDPSAPLDAGSVTLLDPADGSPAATLTVQGEGTYAVQPDGSVVFTPAAGFHGATTQVRYRVADGNGTSSVAAIRIDVGAPPVALDVAATTPQHLPVIVDLLADDVPGTGATLDHTSLVLLDPVTGDALDRLELPGEGTYTVHDDGTVTFAPEAAFVGETTRVGYRFTDSFGDTAAATVVVTVTAVTPVAHDDAATTPYLRPVTVAVLANDVAGAASAPLDPGTVQLIDPADGLDRTSVTITGEGTLTVRPDGTVRFEPVSGFHGAVTPVTYRVADDNGTTSTAVVSVTVQAPADAYTAPDATRTRPSQPVTLDTLRNDRPSEDATWDATSLCLVPSAGSVAGAGTGDPACVSELTVPGQGHWAVVDGKVVFTPAAGFTGTAVVTYRVTDTAGVTLSNTATVDVPATGTGPLAYTGADLARLGGMGAGLLVLGVALVLIGGRRRRTG